MKTKKIYTVILSVLYTLEAAFMISIPYMTSHLVDAAEDGIKKNVILYACLMGAAAALCILFKVISYYCYSSFSLSEEKRLKEELFKRISSKPVSFMAGYKSAEIELLYTKDLDHVESLGLQVIPSFIRLMVRLVLAIALLIYYDWKFLCVVLAFGVLGFLAAKFYSKIMKPRHRRVLEAEGKANGFLVEVSEDYKLVKAYQAEDRTLEYYDNLLNSLVDTKKKRNNILYAGSSMIYAISAIVYVGPLIYGAFGIMYGWFTYGVLLALAELISQVVNPLLSINTLLNQYNLASASKERLDAIMSVEDEISGLNDSSFDEIIFEDVSYSYDKKHDVISHLSLTIKKKDTVLFSGSSGIGKTTLFMLLLGFLKPDSGSIYVIKDTIKHELSYKDISLFSYVPQENVLFSGTIRENIDMLTGADEASMIHALKISNVWDEIDSMRYGLDTHLDNGGKGLSLGQIQRILIACAILRNKEILLLDEFSSALDKENEKTIMENLKGLDKTIIYITHRMNLYPDSKEIHLEENEEI